MAETGALGKDVGGAGADIAEREALIDACEQVLARIGHWDFKVRSVCRQAHLSTHSFYRHFSGKDELVVALLERGVDAVAAQLQAETARGATPGSRVWSFVRAESGRGVEICSSTMVPVDSLNWRIVMAQHGDVYERCIDALAAPLAAALTEGNESGELRSDDPLADARAIVFLIRGNALDRPGVTSAELRAELERSVIPLVSRAVGLKIPSDD